MKKTFFAYALLLVALSCMGQGEIQLNPFAGYFLGGRLNGYEADAEFGQGPDFGIGISYGLGGGKNIELSYTLAVSDASMRRNDNGTYSNETNMTFGYIQAGYVQDFILHNTSADIRPFLLFSLGAGYLNPEDPDFSTAWRFTTAFGGGLKYFFTEHIGIRIQARLLTPMFFDGGGFFCGTGGCGAAVSSFAVLAQGDFTGGLVIMFGGE